MKNCCYYEIENFILYWTSDEEERKKMLECLKAFKKLDDE